MSTIIVESSIQAVLDVSEQDCIAGILLGQLAEEKLHVISFLKTPFESLDGRGNGSTDPWGAERNDLVLDHVSQIARMLCGGVHIVGIAVASKKALPSASSLNIFRDVRNTVKNDHCFLHQFAVIKKVDKGPLLCDLFSAASSSTPLSVAALSRAASVKCVNDVASSLHSFSSVVSVDIHVPLLPKASFQDATSVMESILTYSDVIRAVQASKFSLVDDQRVKDSTQSVGALSPKGTTSSSHYVSFLGSPSLLSPSSSSTSLLGARPCPLVTSTSTLLHITGEIHCKAFVLPKISVVAAIDYVKRDFAESLKARIHVLVEEGNGDAAGSGSNGGSYVMMLPRRVFISLGKIPGTGLCMSDYALSTETAEDVLSRAREMCGTNAALINGEEHRGGPTWTRPHTAESGMGMRYRGDGATPSDTASCTATNDTESGLEKGRSSVMLLAIGGIIALLLCMVFIQKI